VVAAAEADQQIVDDVEEPTPRTPNTGDEVRQPGAKMQKQKPKSKTVKKGKK